MNSRFTASGFEVTTDAGAHITTRLIAEVNGNIVIGVDVDGGERLQVSVSRGGRSVRVHDSKGREWHP